MIDYLIEQRIKDTARIYDVVSQFHQLKKAGTNYQCLCPFHDDRTIGSFSVNVKENYCYCFSCGKGGDPIEFLKLSQGMTYEEALRWIANFYSIEVEGNAHYDYKPKTIAPRPQQPSLPLLIIDNKYPARTLGKDNNFIQWLRSLPWNEEQRERLEKNLNNYFVGTTKDGRVIFWRFNEKCECVNGKVMLYWQGGHRAKTPEGKAIGLTWIHRMFFDSGMADETKVRKDVGIYGLHLINIKPKQVSIVESEKSALICSTMYGNMSDNLWLAIGGLSYLKREALQPLIDLNIKIVLYPDMDGIDRWKEKAKDIKYKHLSVADKWMRDNWREEDGPKADIADILIRIMKTNALDSYPFLKPLAEAFDLELISITKDKDND